MFVFFFCCASRKIVRIHKNTWQSKRQSCRRHVYPVVFLSWLESRQSDLGSLRAASIQILLVRRNVCKNKLRNLFMLFLGCHKQIPHFICILSVNFILNPRENIRVSSYQHVSECDGGSWRNVYDLEKNKSQPKYLQYKFRGEDVEGHNNDNNNSLLFIITQTPWSPL